MANNLSVADLPAPPKSLSVQELPAPPKQEQIGSIEALARGAGQGASMGFSDEALASVQALGSKVKGDNRDLKDLYEEFKKLERYKNEQAEEQHPYLYKGAELAGGVGSATLVPGAATLKGGLALGALTGLGQSKATDLKGAATDSGLGAAGGAVGVGIGSVLGGLLNKTGLRQGAEEAAGKYLGSNPQVEAYINKNFADDPLKALRESGRLGLDNNLLQGDAVKRGAAVGQAMEKYGTQAKDIVSDAQAKFTPEARAATQDSLSSKLSDFMEGITDQYKDRSNYPEIEKKVTEKIGHYNAKISDAIEAGDISALNKLKQTIQGEVTDASKNAFTNEGSGPATNILKGFSGIAKDAVEQAVDKSTGKGAELSDLNRKLQLLYGQSDSAKQALSASTDLPGGVYPSSKGVAKVAIKSLVAPLYKAKANVLDSASKIPGVIEDAGLDASSIGENLSAGSSTGVRQQLGDSLQSLLGKKPENKPAVLSKDLYSANDSDLQLYSNQLKQNPAFRSYGEGLEKAVNEGDNSKKNAILFTLLQNKDARQALHLKD